MPGSCASNGNGGAISDGENTDKHLDLPGSVVELDKAWAKPHILTPRADAFAGWGVSTLQRIEE